MLRAGLLIGLCCLGVSNLYGASFQCSNVTQTVEKLICSDEELSLLDDELAAKYAEPTDYPEERKIAQRRWLRERRNRCADIQCLKKAYEARIYELKWDANYAEKAPRKAIVESLCEQLVRAPERRKILASQQGIEDINNDGLPETAKECWGGTMNTPCTDYADQSGNKIEFEDVGFEWKDYWTYGRQAFRYEGRTFILNSSDDSLAEPSYLSYITPANKEYVLCEFSNQVVAEIDAAEPDNDGVCQDAIGKYSLESIELSEKVETQPDFIKRSETLAIKTGLIDVNNDGVPENVMELAYASGGGRGCDYNYYELIDSSGHGLVRGKMRSEFLKMQGVDDSGYWGRSCGHIENQLFRYKGKTYYERNVENNETSDHVISIQTGDSVRQVCKYRRAIRTKLKGVVVGVPQFDDR